MATAQTTPANRAKTRRTAAPKSAAQAKTAKRATASSAGNSSASAKRSTQAVKNPTVGAYAERAVLIPVGAALIAREQVLARVNDTIGTFGTPAKANAQLRKFERRGNTARNRLEREVRKTRVRVEREVRQTRGRVEREVRQRRHDGEQLANRVQERILSLV
jgi:hypothetical protein